METANVDCLLGTTTPEGKERGRVAVSGTGRAMKRFVFVWIWLLLVFFLRWERPGTFTRRRDSWGDYRKGRGRRMEGVPREHKEE